MKNEGAVVRGGGENAVSLLSIESCVLSTTGVMQRMKKYGRNDIIGLQGAVWTYYKPRLFNVFLIYSFCPHAGPHTAVMDY